jgi:hypothetical protein
MKSDAERLMSAALFLEKILNQGIAQKLYRRHQY